MTNEFDELIWRVLDGKASSEEICRVKEWVQNDEHKRHKNHAGYVYRKSMAAQDTLWSFDLAARFPTFVCYRNDC